MTKKIRGTLFFLSILGDLSNSMILVTSIFYAEHELHLDPFMIGIIGAAYGITYLITPAILGRIGDKLPRKISLLIGAIGHLLTALFFWLFGKSFGLLIVGQISLGIFYGFFWPTIEAYTSETAIDSSEKAHKKGILSFCIAWSIGYMLGPLLAGILSQYLLPAAFFSVVIFYTIELILVLVNLPREKSISQHPIRQPEEEKEIKTKRTTPSVFIQLILTVFLYAISSKILYTYFVDYAVDEGGILLWTKSITGLVLFFFGLGRTLYFVITYYWISIRSSMKLSIFTFLVISICIGIIPLFRSKVILSVIMFLGGICVAIIYSSTLDLILHKEQKGKGAKAGLFESMVGLGSILTPFAAGALAENISYAFPFYGMAGIILVVFIVFLCIELFNYRRQQVNFS